MTVESPENRRPLKTRSAGWAGAMASALGRARVSPDTISFASVAFAVLGAGALGLAGLSEGGGRIAWLLLGALCVQLRLLANMLDGMVAVEHGLGGPAGPIWNELPDRFADTFFLVAAGYGAEAMGQGAGDWLGWSAAVLAIITAYVRELGRGLGFPADFSGPMAKPQRMFVLTLACLIAAADPLWGWSGQTLAIALAIIAAGSLLTVFRRTARLAAQLKERG